MHRPGGHPQSPSANASEVTRQPACRLYQYLSKSSRAATISAARFSPSSPHDTGVGRGPRRGATPSSPQPSPPSDGGEGVFGCGFAALRGIRASPADASGIAGLAGLRRAEFRFQMEAFRLMLGYVRALA